MTHYEINSHSEVLCLHLSAENSAKCERNQVSWANMADPTFVPSFFPSGNPTEIVKSTKTRRIGKEIKATFNH